MHEYSDEEDEPKRKKKKGSCKPPISLRRRFDPDNGPWVGIHKKVEPLPIYKEALEILRKEGYLPPRDDPTLITWPPPKNCRVSNTYISPVSQPILCMMFNPSSFTYDEQFPTMERCVDPVKKSVF